MTRRHEAVMRTGDGSLTSIYYGLHQGFYAILRSIAVSRQES
jgi:hypothetical protein